MDDRLSLYKERSMSMCVEATFDFIRTHIMTWLRLGAVLLLPVCVLLSLHVLTVENDEFLNDTRWDVGFTWGDADMPLVFWLFEAMALWGVLMLVYALLFAAADQALPSSIRGLMRYVRRAAVRSLVSAIMLFVLLWAFLNFTTWFPGLLLAVLLVPMLLVPPVWMMEDCSRSTAVSKGLRLGFSSWFSLFFTVLMVMLIGVIIILVINVPWMILQTILTEIIPVSGESGGGVIFIKWVIFMFTVLAYFCFLMVLSLVLLSCVFHYGSVSERVEDTSLESDIEHFEQL